MKHVVDVMYQLWVQDRIAQYTDTSESYIHFGKVEIIELNNALLITYVDTSHIYII